MQDRPGDRPASGTAGRNDGGPHAKGQLSERVSHAPPGQDFIGKIITELQAGRGFAALVGAGFSSSSGAPIIQELHAYLKACIARSLGLRTAKTPGQMDRPWNPRWDPWPAFQRFSEPSRKPGNKADGWSTVILSELERARHSSKPSDRPKIAATVWQEAHGALAEWRTALLFLSRLVLSQTDRKGYELKLEAPDRAVRDACFDRVLTGIDPTLGHRLLGLLANALRLDVVLTTNFDDLLERAFAEARNPLTVCAVHTHTALPPYRTPPGERVLVKLHGDRHDLRVDYSIDDPPTNEDRWNFLSYLTDEAGRERINRGSRDDIAPNKLVSSRNLLVIGHGLNEARTVALLDHAVRYLDRRFRIFVLCYSAADVATCKTRNQRWTEFRRMNRDTVLGNDPDDACGVCIRYPEFGLFLLQLFQNLRHGLPSYGIIFPSVSRLALPPFPNESVVEGNMDLIGRLANQITQPGFYLVHDGRDKPRYGATSIWSEVFEQKRSHGICLWVDLSSIRSPLDLIEKLWDAYHYRIGREHWKPTRVNGSADEVALADAAEALSSEIKRSRRPWYVFLNGRETAGANFDSPSWLDHHETVEDFDTFWCRLLKKTRAGRTSFGTLSLVLLTRKPPRLPRLRRQFTAGFKLPLLPGQLRAANPDTATREAFEWADGSESRIRFLQTLCLMQRPRHLSVIWSEAVSGADRHTKKPMAWLLRLCALGLIGWKPGGFIWMRCGPRNTLRKRFDTKRKQSPKTVQAHQALIPWYERVFAASAAPSALFEAATHSMKAADLLLKTVPLTEVETGQAVQAIDKAGSLLRAHCFLIQTVGYSRANFIILPELRACAAGLPSTQDHPEVAEAQRRFQIQTLEVERAIARELGIYHHAYEKTAEIAAILGQKNGLAVTQHEPRHQSLQRYVAVEPGKALDRDRLADWLRWWRWNCMLALSSRSYTRGIGISAKLTGIVGQTQPLGVESEADEALMEHLHAILGRGVVPEWTPSSFHARTFVELLRLLEQVIACALERETTRKFLRTMSGRAYNPQRVRFRFADRFASAHRLADRILGENLGANSGTRIEVHWCRYRLLMHEAAYAILTAGTKPAGSTISAAQTGWSRAMALLNDANACIPLAVSWREGPDRAMIELYRADAQLCHAAAILPIPGAKHDASPAVRQRALMLVHDATHFLIRAERVLSRRRRNVWWSTWYFERRLTAIALTLELTNKFKSSRNSHSSPPYFSRDIVAFDQLPLADELLENAQLMIRVDSYRFATIVVAYARCVAAIKDRVPAARHESMTQSLANARERLREIAKARNKVIAGPREKSKKRQVDQEIREIVKLILNSRLRSVVDAFGRIPSPRLP